MLDLRIALAGLAAVAACAGPAPDREAPAGEMPRRELEIARVEEPPAPGSRAATAKPTPPAKQQSTPAVAGAEPARGVPDTMTVEEPDARPDSSAGAAGYTPYSAADSAPRAAEVPPSAPPADAAGVLAVGTVIHATLEDSIHSRHDVPGKEVQARVMQNVTGSDGEVLVPAGSPVRLTVTQVKSGRGGRKGVIEIRTDSVTIEGRPRRLEADIRAIPHELRGRGVTGEDAAKVGVGAAGGAVLGRVITGETEGAVIGGVVGAAGGAVVASETAARDVVVKARTPVELVLTAPLATR